MSVRSRLSIEIAGRSIDSWASYSLASDMLTPSDAFSAVLSLLGTAAERAAILELIDRGQTEVKAYVYQTDDTSAPRVLQHTGLLDARNTGGDKHGGTTISIQCRDRAAHLVDSSADLTAIRNVGTNFLALVSALVSPWGIEVVADGTASRDIATGIALSLPPGAQSTTRAAWSQGAAGGADPSRPVVFTDDEETLARERAAGASRRRALASVRTLGNAAIDPSGAEGAVPSASEQNAILSARDRARALAALAQRRAAESVASNGQSATAIRAVALKEARPQAGESVWAFILRQARRFGLVPWFSPDGKLIIAAPNYGGPVVHRIVRRVVSDAREPNNVIHGTESNAIGNCFSDVTIYGRGLGNDVARAPIVGRASEPSIPFPRPHVIHDLTVRDTDEANRRAQRELMKSIHGRRTLEYVVSDHGNGRALYATDTIVEVLDEVLGITGEWYVVAREFLCDRSNGTTTKLKLVSKGAILL